jgi:hypothetical protein
MIARPTTAQILTDCCAQLLEGILPNVEAGPTQVQLFMLEGVLRNAAVRASHEIAWMQSEREEALAYVSEVAETSEDLELRETLDAASVPPASLHLDDVVAAYDRASDALSRALEVAFANANDTLVERGTALLGERLEREREVQSGWGSVAGR